jgi:hypothetical protein
MKKQFSALLFGMAVALSACQNFPTVKVQTSFNETFAINRAGTTFNETKLIDATNDSEFDKYKRKINSIDIERVTYTIESFNGPSNQVLQSGTLKVADESGTNPVTIAEFSNVNLSAAAGKETDLQTSSTGLARIQDLIKNNPHKAVISYAGSVNQGPVNMNITLKFYSKLTARVVGSN